MPEQATWSISIRIPADLAEWIRNHADDATRSYNGEIVHLLKLARATIERRESLDDVGGAA